ncbi:MAG: hypothetical protein AAB320_03460 [Elusimicrobiota bacterium]
MSRLGAAVALLLLCSCGAPPRRPAAEAAAPLRVVSMDTEIVFDAEGSPRRPYVMELTRVVIRLRNVGGAVLSPQAMEAELAEPEIADFEVENPAMYASNGGYWNPMAGHGLVPGGIAQVWVQGQFTSAGRKSLSVKTGKGTFSAEAVVLPDPGCRDSDGGKNSAERGWAIGTTACAPGLECLMKVRRQDSCLGVTLTEYFCQGEGEAAHVSSESVACPKGCGSGACLK